MVFDIILIQYNLQKSTSVQLYNPLYKRVISICLINIGSKSQDQCQFMRSPLFKRFTCKCGKLYVSLIFQYKKSLIPLKNNKLELPLEFIIFSFMEYFIKFLELIVALLNLYHAVIPFFKKNQQECVLKKPPHHRRFFLSKQNFNLKCLFDETNIEQNILLLSSVTTIFQSIISSQNRFQFANTFIQTHCKLIINKQKVINVHDLCNQKKSLYYDSFQQYH
ncbi:hypothetical protein FGO68_gene13135 [Halteria grandinella]|uniref:Uncharacterized protein n=1 Tax=Halteria grandinella TaxID=5974 RepID=A0A8J8SUY3_HALGN|nr:hypothetical protein FGO68_gene13135 [Halteria grandinella]